MGMGQPALRSPSTVPQEITLWRICKAAYAAFDGEGARLYGGRWNHPGVRVVYASATLSLAALEYFVNVDSDLVPPDLVSVAARVPAGVSVCEVRVDDLPANWRSFPAPEVLKDLGTRWVTSSQSCLLSVPSGVIPEERNYLINPEDPEFAQLKIDPPRHFVFDPRMGE